MHNGHCFLSHVCIHVLHISQGVPSHKSYVVLFKYYGGGEVDYFEVARNFGVEDSVAKPSSTGETHVHLLTLVTK